jgi:hypothetical protein
MTIRAKNAVRLSLIFAAITVWAASGIAGVVSLSPTAFRPIDSVSDNDRVWTSSEKELYTARSVDGPWFAASVNLPQGAAIKKMTVYVTDMGTGSDDEIRVSLNRQNLATGAVESMASVNNHSPSPLPYSTSRQTLVDSTIVNKKVNNKVYTYTVYVRFVMDCTDKVRFNGVKIEF